MEFKGTKGKWKAVNCGKHWNNTSIDNIQIQYGKDGECISDHVYCQYNALLISKAPEMLELHQSELKTLLNLQQTMYDREVSVSIIQEIERMILYKEQLIKQATEL